VAPFSIFGVVTESHGGPIAGATVVARANFGNSPTRTVARDPRGYYEFQALTVSTIIDASQAGFELSLNWGAFGSTTVVDIPLLRRLQVPAGDSLSATLLGDEGESLYPSQPDCDSAVRVCRVIYVSVPGPGTLTPRWTDPTSDLGVWLTGGYVGFTGTHGSSPLTVTAHVSTGGPGTWVDAVVTFESVGGVSPPPRSASQVIRLDTAFAPGQSSLRCFGR
jgi:hypothetical protein